MLAQEYKRYAVRESHLLIRETLEVIQRRQLLLFSRSEDREGVGGEEAPSLFPIDKNTTLTEMIRSYLETLVRRGAAEKERAVKALEQTFNVHSRDMGRRTWTRDSLHDR